MKIKKVKLNMKRHLLGVIFLLISFALGLFLSPIRFDVTGMVDGMIDDNGIGSYWCDSYTSIYFVYFVKLINEGENYKTSEKAKEIFLKRLKKSENKEIISQDILEQNESRAVVHFQIKDGLDKYCIFRVKDKHLRNICSTSLWHVYEFERQNYKD